MRREPCALAVLALAACAAPPPEPLDPVASEQAFRDRSLHDPDLLAWLGAQLERPPAAPGGPWDLAALTRVALFFHPDLDVARARVARAEAAETTASALPNPDLGAGLQFNADLSGPASPWTWYLDALLPVDVLWKRGIRLERARQLTVAARLELAATAWQVRSRLRAALAAHLLDARESELRARDEEIAAAIAGRIEARLAAGTVARPAVDRARLAALAARMARRVAEGRARQSRARLAAALGLPVAALAEARLTWSGLATPPQVEDLPLARVQPAGLINRLDLRRLLAEYMAAEAAVRLEVRRQYPSLALGPALIWEESEKKFAFNFSFSLPILNRNEGPLAEALAARRELAVRVQGLQARVLGELERDLATWRTRRLALDDAAASLDLARERATHIARLVAAGEIDPLEGDRAQRAVVAAELLRLDALRRVQEALGALEDDVQAPLDGSPPTREAER